MNVSVYYEEHEVFGTLCPIRANFYFGRGEIQWDKEKLILPTKFPFRKMTADDIFPDVTSVMLMIGDLFKHPVHEGKFGIYLPFILERLEKHKLDTGAKYEYEDIEQFIIQVSDIETVMQSRLITLHNEEDF